MKRFRVLRFVATVPVITETATITFGPTGPNEPVTVYAMAIAAAREVTVMAGGVELSPHSIVAISDMAGIYQISVRLPSGASAGDMSMSLKIKTVDASVVTSYSCL